MQSPVVASVQPDYELVCLAKNDYKREEESNSLCEFQFHNLHRTNHHTYSMQINRLWILIIGFAAVHLTLDINVFNELQIDDENIVQF